MNPTVTMLLYVVVIVGFFYFALIRPSKQKMESQRRVLDTVAPGSRVMLSSGLFGTVRAVGQKQIVVELAPGVDVTVIKMAVSQVLTADDEEFEYDDGDFDETEEADFDAEFDDLESALVDEPDEEPVDAANTGVDAVPVDLDAAPADSTDDPTRGQR